MKITASRKDDILKDRERYEAQKKAYNESRSKSWNTYLDALENVYQPSIDAVKFALGADAENLTINFDTHYNEGIKVEISNSPGGWSRQEPEASLSWIWKAYLNRDGEVVKESSSWSGLEATTYDQIEDLKQCVRQLEIINNLDWKQLLDLSLPQYEDFVDNDVKRPDDDLSSRNFQQELEEAEIEECIGQPILVKCSKYYEGRYYRGQVYLQFIKDSGSQYSVNEVPASPIERFLDGRHTEYYDAENIHSLADLVNKYDDPIRVRKDRVLNGIVYPLETVEF